MSTQAKNLQSAPSPAATGGSESVTSPSESAHLYQLERVAITHLFNLPPQEIAHYDIAEMNLICARGLPGAENLDIGSMLGLLDLWAKRCQTFIAQKASLYHTNPAKFGSLAKFYVQSMIQVLTRQLGVRYNPRLTGEPGHYTEPITDPADTFIHGILGPKRTGTCATLPVVLTALGRRLDYPLKLVLAPEHSFCRWDSPEERFNIEFDELGISFHPDDYYREWPYKWTPEVHERQRVRPYFLISLTPQQELAHFAWCRAYHVNVVGSTRCQEALAAMQVAQRLWPTHTHAVWITHLTTKALYPERNWPHAPCEETAGKAAVERLIREQGAVMLNTPRAVAMR